MVIFPNLTAPRQPSVWHHHIHAHQPFPKPNLQVHIPVHTNVFTLTHTWVKTSYEALALGCSLLPPLSWPSEHVASGARRGTFLLVLPSAHKPAGPEACAAEVGMGLGRCSGHILSGQGGALGPSLHLHPWVIQVVEPPTALPEFSPAFFLFVAYWHSSCNKHPELTAFFFFSFWPVPLRL